MVLIRLAKMPFSIQPRSLLFQNMNNKECVFLILARVILEQNELALHVVHHSLQMLTVLATHEALDSVCQQIIMYVAIKCLFMTLAVNVKNSQ